MPAAAISGKHQRFVTGRSWNGIPFKSIELTLFFFGIGPVSNMDTKLTREQWLGKALDILHSDTFGKLNIDRLGRSMGVSKGSFYWHFQGKKDFVTQLVDHWERVFTIAVINHIDGYDGETSDKILELMEYVTLNQLARYDSMIQSLAKDEPHVFLAVKRVFDKRVRYVTSLLGSFGFTEDQLQFRGRALVMLIIQEQNSLYSEPIDVQLKRIKLAHRLFTMQTETSSSR